MSDTYTKGIYIKGEEGLSSLVRTSKEDISDVLGYTPATEQSVTDVNSNLTEHINNNDAGKQHITEEEKNKLLHLSYDDLENAPAISDDDNSGTLYIADDYDHVIAKVDSEGVHSVGFHAGEEGITGDGETFIIVDKNDNKALEIEANGGVRVGELYLGQSGGPLSEILTDQVEEIGGLATTINDHIIDEARHVSPEEQARWDDKSFTSITDNPIEVTEDGEFVIVDDNDNKGLVLDGTGLTVDKEVYIQTKEGEANKVAVAKTLGEVQVSIQQLRNDIADIGELSNVMNFRGGFSSFDGVPGPIEVGDVIIITNDYVDPIYGDVKANSEWVRDEAGAWVEIGTASATDAEVAKIKDILDIDDTDYSKNRLTAIEKEFGDFKEEISAQLEELPEIPEWVIQPTAPTYEYDDLTIRPQIEDYIEDDEFIIADSEDRKGLQLTKDGLETVGNVIITYKDEDEQEHVLDVRQKFAEVDTSISEMINNTKLVQADWEENDATSNAYIKNRPFYVNGYIVPFATLQFQKSEYNNNYKSTNIVNLVAEEGIDGKEYIVEWDGVEYTTTCRTVKFNTPGTVLGESIGLEHFIGNSALLNSDIATSTEQDTGEPFALRLTKEQFDGWNSVFHMDLGCVVTKSLNSTHTIRISGGDNIVKLSEKYLPDGIATEDFVREQIAAIEIPEGGNSGPVHWNDITNKPFIVVEENKRMFVDHSKVDTNIAFTSAELNATFVRLTEETLSKNELIGSTITATFASGSKISGIVSESSIQFEDDNGLILIVEDLPIAVFYKAGQYTANIYGVETTVQVPTAGIYTTDYAITELASSEITTNVVEEYLDNKCLSILEISSKPTEFLHEIEFTNQWNDLFRIYTYLNPIDEETFNAWNANTQPVVVKYDGAEYICLPQVLSLGTTAGVVVGNLVNFGGTGNNEPFAITCGYDNAAGLYFTIIGSTVDMEPTVHSAAIHLQDETYKIKDEYFEDFRKEISEQIVSESHELIVVDKDGNIVTRVDENGLETTTVIADSIILNGQDLQKQLDEIGSISNPDIEELWNTIFKEEEA